MSFEREMDWMGHARAPMDTGDDIEETSFTTGTDGDDIVNLPDVPLVPPQEVQQQLDASGDSIQSMRDDLST